jgi:hypothetical protein
VLFDLPIVDDLELQGELLAMHITEAYRHAPVGSPMPMHAPVVLTGAELGSTTDGMWRTGVLYSTVLYGTLRYSTVLYGNLRYNRAVANLVLPR